MWGGDGSSDSIHPSGWATIHHLSIVCVWGGGHTRQSVPGPGGGGERQLSEPGFFLLPHGPEVYLRLVLLVLEQAPKAHKHTSWDGPLR